MSWHRAGVLLLGAQSCLPVPEVPAVGGIGSVLLSMARMGWKLCHVFRLYTVVMAGSVTRRGLDMTGFVLELRGMCVVLGYPHGVDYQARPLPEQEGDDAEPHAGWEVTAVILAGSPERTSLAVTAGGDSFPAACIWPCSSTIPWWRYTDKGRAHLLTCEDERDWGQHWFARTW
uniref:Retrotransposon protein, putative, Ty3-gypsy subclass n=1 Tax=Oryza sativa subsp. japonica TaxID=39947 RepID=Q2QTE0_ORYSJ|nr:retrotransposon protein, putative, Ty3-gypsy subclass [Oryza sativa Japonica Group]